MSDMKVSTAAMIIIFGLTLAAAAEWYTGPSSNRYVIPEGHQLTCTVSKKEGP